LRELLAALRLQTWLSMNLRNDHQFPQSSTRATLMTCVCLYIPTLHTVLQT